MHYEKYLNFAVDSFMLVIRFQGQLNCDGMHVIHMIAGFCIHKPLLPIRTQYMLKLPNQSLVNLLYHINAIIRGDFIEKRSCLTTIPLNI